MAIGYIELDDWLPFRKMFAYMDASDHYRADDLLRKYKLRVKFKNEWCAPNNLTTSSTVVSVSSTTSWRAAPAMISSSVVIVPTIAAASIGCKI